MLNINIIMNVYKLLIVIVLVLITVDANAQRRRNNRTIPLKIEELPRRPMDTITTADPETKVIIYSNNTWEFYRPDIESRLSDHDAYKYNWDTLSIFSYRNVELADIPAVVELKLVDSLGDFAAPIIGRVSSKYGPRRRVSHHGTDVPLRIGEPLLATFDGKVRYSMFNPGGYGHMVIIRHPNGLETWYAHLSKINTTVGDYVKAGQIIGYGGNSGNSYGSHLHFEMRYKDQSFDPEFLIDFESGQLRYQTFALEKSFFSIRSRASEILEEEDYDFDLPGSLLAETNDSTVKTVQKPKPQVQQTGTIYHKVVQGDNLGKIAGMYKVSVDQICRLNGISTKTILNLNRKLLIK